MTMKVARDLNVPIHDDDGLAHLDSAMNADNLHPIYFRTLR